MECSKECKESYQKYLKDLVEYFIQWPFHCKACRGWGGDFTTYDPSPTGVSLGSGYFWDFEPCEKCCESSKCPRCGGLLDDIEEFELPCSHCGFEFDGSTDGEPNDFECYCDQVQESITDDF